MLYDVTIQVSGTVYIEAESQETATEIAEMFGGLSVEHAAADQAQLDGVEVTNVDGCARCDKAQAPCNHPNHEG